MNRAVLTDAVARLAAAGIASPRVDAELLAAHVLGVDRGRLVVAEEMTAAHLAHLDRLLARRIAREPLQHILGTAPFGPVDLAVGPGVFIPRPETEVLLQWAVRACAGTRRPRVVDLCSGSGALAISIATAVDVATVVAVEHDPDALLWLRHNVARADTSTRVRVVVVDGDARDQSLLAAGSAEVVVSNPPYVPDGTHLAPEVCEHDPAVAVFGGPDGMTVITPMIALIARALVPGGCCAIEHDDTTADLVVAALGASRAFDEIEEHTDLAGRPRFVSARRSGASPTHDVQG